MEDTIAAIATALGKGAISIIRVSGNEAISLVDQIWDGKDLTKVKSHTIHYGHIVYQNEIIDEVLVSIMKEPKTYTKEDIVEINCHGGIATTNRVLEILLTIGARLAMPGEFSKRAFLNGRIDLVEAEAVMDLIEGKTEEARKISIHQLNGQTSNYIRNFRKRLLELLASIEVNIDYPEYEDNIEVTNQKIEEELTTMKKEMNEIIVRSENGQLKKHGIKTIILGRPNVGKSSILNCLLEEEKAIVTDIAGTTRDIVEGTITIDGILLNIIDTAGIRNTEDIVEKIGVEKSLSLITEADLILVVLNQNEPLTEEDLELLEKTKEMPSIIVLNKNDLKMNIDREPIKDRQVVYTNTKEEEGILPLKMKIKEMFNQEQIASKDLNYLSNVRQISLAKKAYHIIDDIEKALEENMPIDMVEIDIKRVWETLGEITGDTYSEELIDQLFSQFCLGK